MTLKMKNLSVNQLFKIEGSDEVLTCLPKMGLNYENGDFLINALRTSKPNNDGECPKHEAFFINPDTPVTLHGTTKTFHLQYRGGFTNSWINFIDDSLAPIEFLTVEGATAVAVDLAAFSTFPQITHEDEPAWLIKDSEGNIVKEL